MNKDVKGMIHIPGVNDEAYEKYINSLPKTEKPRVNRNNYFSGADDYWTEDVIRSHFTDY